MPKANLTELSVRALKAPRNGQVTYWDKSIPGFGIRVSQGGTKTFTLVHGYRRERVSIGRYPVLSLAEARAEARRMLAEQTLGHFRPRSITWEEAVTAFLSSCEQRNRPRTIRDYTRLLKRHFPFDRKRLSEITPHDIHRRIDRLKDTPSEQNHALVTAKIFFNWAVRRRHIEKSPCDGMRPPARTAPRDRVLSDAELASVYRTALEGTDPFSQIVALLVLTGQRRGEIASLRWEWINLNERTITLPSSITKNRRVHAFPFGNAAQGVLKAVLRFNDYVFPSSREHVRGRPSTIFNGWGKAKEDFDGRLDNVAPYTLHDLRRTFSSGMAALGVPIHVTEKLLNYASGTVSGVAAIYNRHAYMDEMREAIDAWEAKLAQLLEEHPPET